MARVPGEGPGCVLHAGSRRCPACVRTACMPACSRMGRQRCLQVVRQVAGWVAGWLGGSADWPLQPNSSAALCGAAGTVGAGTAAAAQACPILPAAALGYPHGSPARLPAALRFPHSLRPPQVFTTTGTFLREWTSAGGTGGVAFDSPSYVCVDKNDDIYIAEAGNSDIDGQVKKVTRDGSLLLKWGTLGSDISQFRGIGGIETDAVGDVFVSDPWNCRVQKFRADGSFILQFGSCGSQPWNMDYTKGLVVDNSGGVWVVDAGYNAVKKYGGTGVM